MNALAMTSVSSGFTHSVQLDRNLSVVHTRRPQEIKAKQHEVTLGSRMGMIDVAVRVLIQRNDVRIHAVVLHVSV